ncbi:MAG: hypothetical protein HY000_38485 [Planctomycetes bacterium]|nr:hypothetical protein [Planctomycetota bacterium]
MDCSVLLIGGSQSREFAAVRESLRGRRVADCPEIAAAIGMLAAGQQEPELIILLQAWPSEFDPAALEELRRRAPLARVVNILGSWCEGETRSGTPLAGTTRLYWHQWQAHCALDEIQMAAGVCPSWGLPVTATEEDRLLWAAEHPAPVFLDKGKELPIVGILSNQQATWEWLASACEQLGCRAIWLRPDQVHERLSVILWGYAGDPSEESQLSAVLASQSDRPPVLALVTFPRAGDLQDLSRLGVTALIGKPVRLDELRWHLQSLQGGVERTAPGW